MSPVRQPFPDLVRAFALFGIAVVNVDYIAHATMSGVIANAWATPADRLVWWTVATLFLIKSYPLFALMLDAGIAQQTQSTAADGMGLPGRHWAAWSACSRSGSWTRRSCTAATSSPPRRRSAQWCSCSAA